MEEIVRREYNPWGDNTIITYADGSKGIASKDVHGDIEIVISKGGKEIATVIEKEGFFGNTEYKTHYKDGGSSTTIHNRNALFSPTNNTVRSNGESSNSSYYEEILNQGSKNSETQNRNNNNIQDKKFSNTYRDISREEDKKMSTENSQEDKQAQWAQKEVKDILDKTPRGDWRITLETIIKRKESGGNIALEAIKTLRKINHGRSLSSIPIVCSSNDYDPRVRYEIFKDTMDIPMGGIYNNNCNYLAKYDPYPKIRLAALKRLDSREYQETFSLIASREKNHEIQLEAIKMIRKPSLQEYQQMQSHVYRNIENIAKGMIQASREVRREALKKIINDEVLYDIAREDTYEQFSLFALGQIQDRKYIESLQNTSRHRSIRKKATNIIDPGKLSLIQKIAKGIMDNFSKPR